MDNVSLVADVGGTNTRVALADGANILTESIERFRNADHDGLESVLRQFCKSQGNVGCIGAAVAVAGPVNDGKGELTNLAWAFDRQTVADATGAKTVAIINDLQAQGHALGRIASENLTQVLTAQSPRVSSTKMVIGVGTGFNIAPVFVSQGRAIVPPSEAGHVSLPVQNDADASLAAFIANRESFASVEGALSGRGVENTYAWASSRSGAEDSKSSTDVMAEAAKGHPLAVEATQQLTRTLAIVAGDLALHYLPYGGIYLIGGVSRAMAPYLSSKRFADAFCEKGRFSELMQSFPIFVVEDDFAALTGLAEHLNDLI